MIDTHTHLYVEQFDDDRSDMIERAIKNGVSKFLLPNINVDTISEMEKMTVNFPNACYAMMGLHPSEIKENWEEQIEQIKTFFQRGHHVGIGEIGIDLYWDKTYREEQIHAFRAQIRWAKEEKLPVSIHCRNSFDEILMVLDEENDDDLSGVLHCFTGNLEQANHIINYGNFKLGIGGVVTFKKSGLDEVLKHIDLEHLVLETDSPYLAPTPYRGKRNESGYVPFIAQKLSNIYGVSEEEIDQITTKSALEIFKLLQHE
ncbi:MAG: TatD family hydrolase [Brumimicrobium sp.]